MRVHMHMCVPCLQLTDEFKEARDWIQVGIHPCSGIKAR